jgi:hypothetical protein
MLTSPRIYIALSRNEIVVRNLDTGDEVRESASVLRGNGSSVQPFAHPRVVVGDVEAAVQLIRGCYAKVRSNMRLRPPVFFVHWRGALEGGMSQIEMRALEEVARSAGAARAILITQEDALTEDELHKLKEFAA